MKLPDALGRQFQGFNQLAGHLGPGLRQFLAADTKFGQLRAIQQFSVAPNCGVAVPPHILNDAHHRLLRRNAVTEYFFGFRNHGLRQRTQVKRVGTGEHFTRLLQSVDYVKPHLDTL